MSLSELKTARRLPPLETGDQLSSEEFLRRYEAMPHLKKAELIDGVVYVASSTRWDEHAVPHQALNMTLTVYWARNRSRVEGDRRIGGHRTEKILPGYAGRSDIDQTDACKSTADDPVTNRPSSSLHATFFAALSPTGFVPSDQRIQ
jgi:hypothetical protein